MKIGVLDANYKNTLAGGTITYIIKYIIPAITSTDNELMIFSYGNRFGSLSVEEGAVESGVDYLRINPKNFEDYRERLSDLDIIITSDVFASWDNKLSLDLYNKLDELEVPILVTCHSSPDIVSKNKSADHKLNLLTHPQLKSIMIFRSKFYDLIMEYADKYDLTLKYTDKDDYIIHHPYVGYLDDSNYVPWKDRPNSLIFTGRTSPSTKYYKVLRSIHHGFSNSFDSYEYATDYEGAWYWDKVKVDHETSLFTEEQLSKFNLIKSYDSTTLPSIAYSGRYTCIPTIMKSSVFPGEWTLQEGMYLGLIPLCSRQLIEGCPDELSFMLDFTHSTSMKDIPHYDNLVSNYTDDQLSEISNKIRDYAKTNWGSLDKAKDHLLSIITK